MKQELLKAVGSVKGHLRFKENRAAKLISRWTELSDKFAGMVERGRGESEQARHALGLLIMMETGMRVGNEGSAEGWVCDNEIRAKRDGIASSDGQFFKAGDPVKEGDVVYRHPLFGQQVATFGLTTLLNEHVCRKRGRVILSFTGKKLVEQELTVRHPAVVRHCPLGPPEERWLGVEYPSLKRFVKRFVGGGFTPKDLRTAKVNLLFIKAWEEDGFGERFDAATKKSEAKSILTQTIEAVAATIGHTSGVCRNSYLSAGLLEHLLNKIKQPSVREQSLSTWSP